MTVQQIRVAALGAALAFVALSQTPSAWAGWGGPMTVEVSTVREEMLGQTIYLTGDLRASRRALVGSQVEGRVNEVFVDEGSVVEKGDPLIRLDTAMLDLHVARDAARLEAARARLLTAQTMHRSQQELYREGVIGETRFIEIDAAYQAASAELAEIAANLDISREDLRRATIVSPFDGIIARVHTEVGEWMETGGDVVDVFDTSEMEVIVEAPETVVSRMQVGQPSDLLVNALPGTTIRGEVTAVEPVPDLTNRTFPVHIRVFDPPDALLPGMFVRAAVVTEQPASTVLVSADALIDRGRGTEVWVAAEGLEGLTVQARRIETGRRRGSDIEVLVGLAEGDRVVTAGQDMLFPGASVAIAGEPPAEPMAPGAPAE